MDIRAYARFLCGLILLLPTAVRAADETQPAQDNAPKFELFDGDRVVFLGNTLIERAQKYGYWETMLTARYPDRKIIFRNLGWDGDTVWAESRGIFDPPEKGYQRMLEHVGRIKPTVIFLGYGNNEAFAGKEGLPAFIEQYNRLLDDLTKVSAEGVRFVILSPLRHENLGPPLPDPKEVNQKTKAYSDALAQLAERRQLRFIDLFSTIVQEVSPPNGNIAGIDVSFFDSSTTRDGLHLRPHGYKRLAKANYLQLSLRKNFNLEIDADGTIKAAEGMKVQDVKATEVGLRFTVTNKRLFVDNEWFYELPEYRVAVTGLSRGTYKLKIDGEVAPATLFRLFDADEEFNTVFLRISKSTHEYPAKTWKNGITLNHGPDIDQLEKLRQAIIEKNRLYFHSWRPQNVTYLFLFRKHEQGQNAEEVEEFRKLVEEKEKEIDRLKQPVAHTYELIRVEENTK